MKKSRFTDSQILTILKQAENGTPVAELCREHGMSSAAFLLHDLNGLISVLFVYFAGINRTDTVALQERHDGAYFLLFLPRLGNHAHASLADARNFDKAVTFRLDYLQRCFAEDSYDAPGHDRVYSLDQPGAKVFFDTLHRCRHGTFVEHDLELFAEFGVIRPFPTHFQDFTRRWVQNGTHHRHQIAATVNLHLADGVTIFIIGAGDALKSGTEALGYPCRSTRDEDCAGVEGDADAMTPGYHEFGLNTLVTLTSIFFIFI